jgi:membrane-associated phospholipid phosphatase
MEPSIINKNDKILISASILTSVLLIPSLDKKISDYMRETNLHKNAIINAVMKGGNIWGVGSVCVSILMYIILKNKEIGLNALKATLIGTTVARCLSVLIGRTRPFASPDNASNFNLLKGLKYSLASLPSGHATVAFAFAAAVDKSTPNSLMKTALLYIMASITAISRVYHDKHWVSDVVMGGTLGYLIGSKI